MHMLYTEPQIARSTLAAVRNRSPVAVALSPLNPRCIWLTPGYTPQRIVQLTGQSPTLTCTNRTAA